MRPSIGFAAIELLEAGGAEVFVPPSADLLRPACLQLGRPRRREGARREARRRVRVLRLPGGAVGLVQRHDQDALCRPLRRRSGDGEARRRARGQDLRAHAVPGRRPEARARSRPLRRHDHLSRQLRRAARDGRQVRSRARCSRRCPGSRSPRWANARSAAASAERSRSSSARSRRVSPTTNARRRRHAARAPSCWAISAAC